MAMRVEFNQGIPRGCVDWLWSNVGNGNIPQRVSEAQGAVYRSAEPDDKWFYERITKPKIPVSYDDDHFIYVPTITVHDEKMAILFILRWK